MLLWNILAFIILTMSEWNRVHIFLANYFVYAFLPLILFSFYQN